MLCVAHGRKKRDSPCSERLCGFTGGPGTGGFPSDVPSVRKSSGTYRRLDRPGRPCQLSPSHAHPPHGGGTSCVLSAPRNRPCAPVAHYGSMFLPVLLGGDASRHEVQTEVRGAHLLGALLSGGAGSGGAGPGRAAGRCVCATRDEFCGGYREERMSGGSDAQWWGNCSTCKVWTWRVSHDTSRYICGRCGGRVPPVKDTFPREQDRGIQRRMARRQRTSRRLHRRKSRRSCCFRPDDDEKATDSPRPPLSVQIV